MARPQCDTPLVDYRLCGFLAPRIFRSLGCRVFCGGFYQGSSAATQTRKWVMLYHKFVLWRSCSQGSAFLSSCFSFLISCFHFFFLFFSCLVLFSFPLSFCILPLSCFLLYCLLPLSFGVWPSLPTAGLVTRSSECWLMFWY